MQGSSFPIQRCAAASERYQLPMQSSSSHRKGWDREEVHLGASVTIFGNVCLGVYGQ